MKQQQQQRQQQQQNQPNFAGYGPAGWQRGDQFLEDAVCKRLTADRSLDATGMQVAIQDGNVTLTGYVPTQKARETANRITMSVYGVRNVNNHLTIGIATSQPQSSATGAGSGRTRS